MSAPLTCAQGRVEIRVGDCRALMREMPAESVHACVCDPPYHLTSITKRFGAEGAAPAKVGATGAYARASRGFMGQTWDGGDVAFDPATWAEVFRVLKPGAHLIAFGGTRTYHRIASAIEDAGFEIRDGLADLFDAGPAWVRFLASLDEPHLKALSRALAGSPHGLLAWLYGSGFPKSHDVARSIDRHLGWWDEDEIARGEMSHAAAFHEGEGTALKPAWEPVIFARKPLDGTVAANALRYCIGGLRIDECRVDPKGPRPLIASDNREALNTFGDGLNGSRRVGATNLGRWPANVVHDGSGAVIAAMPDAPGQAAAVRPDSGSGIKTDNVFGAFATNSDCDPRGDSGSAARFFYCAKPSAAERGAANKHPTVKPAALMAHLCKLVTPPGGLILDPFAGSGTTGLAAARHGFRAILMEQSAEYAEMARARIASDWREPEVIEVSDEIDLGPLFSGDAA